MDPEGKINIMKTDITSNLLFIAGTTVLNKAATKTAQFAEEIVEILLEAGLGVVNSMGNTLAQHCAVLPLHHADCRLAAVEGV